jgi:hypothetical protein
MNPRALYLDSVELRHTANQILAERDPASVAGKALPTVSIDLSSDDPLRTHRYLAVAFTEFCTTWGLECEYLAEAGVEIAAGLEKAAKEMLDAMCRVADDTLSIVKPLE